MATIILVVPEHRGSDAEKTRQDFQKIAAAIKSEGFGCRLVRNRRWAQVLLLPLWLGRTVSISMIGKNKRKLLPGRYFAGQHHHKIDEYRTLQSAGAPIPRWEELKPDTKLNLEEWGPYVVEKPSLGWLGADVKIKRTARVKFTPPSSYPKNHAGSRGPMIVQKFVYTGEWPVSWRVVTVFGEVVLCYRQVTRRGQPLKKRWGFDSGGVAIVSNTSSMEIELDMNREVIDVARKAHLAAFPDVPLLHFDIGKDIETGEFAIFECHPFHPLWPFSSNMGLSLQAANQVDYDSQFDAMSTIGRAVVKKARETLGD